MYSVVSTAIVQGIDSILVQVEADVSDGLPVFEMVGFLAAEVKESKERVRTALRNCGYQLPAKRITVNFSPAFLRKSGSGFDLPITVAILAALGLIKQANLSSYLMMGEVRLDGSISGVSGVLPAVLKAKEEGFSYCIVPSENAKEATMVEGISIFAVSHIIEVLDCLNDRNKEQLLVEPLHDISTKDTAIDFSDISGQYLLRRACEIAVSGMHNLLMIGPPGAGKSMIAKRIPTVLPPLEAKERLEVAKIYSVCGLLGSLDGQGFLSDQRPFRAPHHTITSLGLAGGGRIPKPGEVSLAHKGVLFLDELTEFQNTTIEILRQPLEDKKIFISRTYGSFSYPADFLLIAAMNPCKCGYYPDFQRCNCSTRSIQRYREKLSKPILDRIDLTVEVSPVKYEELISSKKGESSEAIRERVLAAFEIQKQRLQDKNLLFNSQISAKDIEGYCNLGVKEREMMERLYQKMDLSARSYHKILKVARTIADMDGSVNVTRKHLTEAVCYRTMEH